MRPKQQEAVPPSGRREARLCTEKWQTCTRFNCCFWPNGFKLLSLPCDGKQPDPGALRTTEAHVAKGTSCYPPGREVTPSANSSMECTSPGLKEGRTGSCERKEGTLDRLQTEDSSGSHGDTTPGFWRASKPTLDEHQHSALLFL